MIKGALARFIGAAVTMVLIFSQSAPAEERIALVIGNGSYEEAPLDSPPRDAELMAETLRSLDFAVTVKQDADQKTMKRLIREFGKRLKKASDAVGFFYYSGHGMQVKGRNYMIPVDAIIEDEPDVLLEGVRADSVLVRMEYAGATLNIVVLDACRNNPFEKRFKSPGEGTGLATMPAPAGTLIAYATAPGDVASPGPKGGYSPFTEILASELRTSRASVLDLFNEVSAKVYKQTKRKQRPYVESSVVPSFAFTVIKDEELPTKLARPSGLYLRDNYGKGTKAKSHMFDVINTGDSYDGSYPNNFEDHVNTACFSREVTQAKRLSWADLYHCES